jgi:Sec-independent protein translocase protein TatA
MLGEIFGMDGIVVIVILAVLVFGGAAIPKLARNLGSAKHQFEKGQAEGKKAAVVEGTQPATASTSALVE